MQSERREFPMVIRNALREVLDMVLLHKNTPEEIWRFVYDYVARMLRREVAFKDLVVTIKLTKEPTKAEEWHTEQAMVVREWRLLNPATAPAPGDRVPFCYARVADPRAQAYQRTHAPWMFWESPDRTSLSTQFIDFEYYVSLLENPMTRLLHVIFPVMELRSLFDVRRYARLNVVPPMKTRAAVSVPDSVPADDADADAGAIDSEDEEEEEEEEEIGVGVGVGDAVPTAPNMSEMIKASAKAAAAAAPERSVVRVLKPRDAEIMRMRRHGTVAAAMRPDVDVDAASSMTKLRKERAATTSARITDFFRKKRAASVGVDELRDGAAGAADAAAEAASDDESDDDGDSDDSDFGSDDDDDGFGDDGFDDDE